MKNKMLPFLFSTLVLAGCSTIQENVANVDQADLRYLPDWRLGNIQEKKDPELHRRERDFARFSWSYAIASDVVYEDAEHIPFAENETWTQLDIDQEDLLSTGFYGKSWVRTLPDNTSELVVSFRGTDSAVDFFRGNFVFVPYIFGTTQFDAAMQFTDDAISAAKKQHIGYSKLVLVGHSLGGGLAQYVQPFKENSLAVVFNPSPNKGRIYSLFSSHVSDINAVRLYEDGEALEFVRWLALDFDIEPDQSPMEEGERTIWLDFFTSGAFEGHGIKDFTMALVKLAAEDGDTEAKSVVDVLKKRRKEG